MSGTYKIIPILPPSTVMLNMNTNICNWCSYFYNNIWFVIVVVPRLLGVKHQYAEIT